MACTCRQVLARFGEGLFRSFTSAGEGQPRAGGREPAGMGWVGVLRVGRWGGFSLVCPSFTTSPPSHLQGALIRAETAKREKPVLANKLFAVYEQVKAELE